MKYDYITRIENAALESKFVFDKVGFNTELPPNHGTSASKSKQTVPKLTTADHYATVPYQTVIEIYRKYYLDFVLFGFSADSVLDVVHASSQKRQTAKGKKLALKKLALGVDQEKTLYPDEQYENCDNL